jgi:hypothetical protein
MAVLSRRADSRFGTRSTRKTFYEHCGTCALAGYIACKIVSVRGVLVILGLASCGRLSFDGRGDAGSDSGNKDAPSNLDDGGAATCNSIARIADDFATDSRARLWGGSYTDDTSMITVGAHLATLNIAVNAANTYVGLVSGRYYDLRGRRVFTGIQQVANPKTTTGLGIGIDNKTLAHLVVEDGYVIAVHEVDGVYIQRAMLPYDPIAAHYFAFSERGGRLYWETSRDAITFDVLYDEPDPFDLSLVDTTMFAGAAIANADPGKAVFDTFNGGVPAELTACKAATLVDPFGDPGHLWENSFADGCCKDSEANGQVVLSSDGSPGFAGRRSSAGYDLRDSQIMAATKGPQLVSKLYGALTAVIDKQDYLALEMRTDGYECNAVVGGTLQQTPAALGPGDAFIRLRESAGTVSYEASSDGMTWRVLATMPTPIDVSDLLIGFEIGNTVTTSANSVAFDGFNAP